MPRAFGYAGGMQPDVWEETAKVLDDMDFPAGKDDLAAHAGERTSSQEVLRLLRALPLGTYENLAEVRRSVRLDTAAEEGQTTSRRAEQNRSRHSHQIAEHLRDVDEQELRHRGGV